MGEDWVEWFMKEMIGTETKMKKNFETDIAIISRTIPETYGKQMLVNWKLIWKEVEATKASNPTRDRDFAKQVCKDPCYLTGRFRGLAHNECNFNTREAHSLFIPILFHNFSGKDCYLIFEKLVNKAIEKDNKTKEDFLAESSENHISVKLGFFIIFGFLQISGW